MTRDLSKALLILAIAAGIAGCGDLRGDRKRRDLGAPAGGSVTAPDSGSGSAGSGSSSPLPPATSPAWSFQGYQVLEQTLREELKLTGSNRDPAAESSILSQLRANAANFGQSNYAAGLPQNLSAEPAKFKFLTELTADACTVAMRDPIVRGRLFPNVLAIGDWAKAGSYDHAFRRLIGRRPSSTEISILNRLVQDAAISKVVNPPYLNQAAAVCAVVLNSLEFNHGR